MVRVRVRIRRYFLAFVRSNVVRSKVAHPLTQPLTSQTRGHVTLDRSRDLANPMSALHHGDNALIS